MRKLATNTFVTLDGVMQAPGGPDEDTSGGFTHGGWLVKYTTDEILKRLGTMMSKPFDLLVGRRTYEIFAAYWPQVTNDPIADGLNRARKYVASRTLTRADWKGSELIRGDVAEEVARLKEVEGPEIMVQGSGKLIQTLLSHDLIDEYRIWIFPLVLGEGKRLFADGTIPTGLKLTDCTTSDAGVIISTFERGGAVVTGDVGESEAYSRFAPSTA
jgi:dihydrofolate reductase